MDSVITVVRARTGGDIAVVTLRDLGGRTASDVALRIGREWRVGGRGPAADPANNLGVIILLKPREGGRPGTGDLFIATGRGAEGVLPDARAGRIRDAMVPFLAREQYGPALALGVDSVAAAFLERVDGRAAPPAAATPPPRQRRVAPTQVLAIAVVVAVALMVLLLVGAATRSGVRPRRRRHRFWIVPGSWHHGGSWGGWSGGGGWGGGGGGGGFGGFGGGGGFSGGGAGGKF
jgi:uncharacterized protein